MDGQQLITITIVGVAAVYLGRNAVRSTQAFFSKKGGCSSGCGKCAFAQQVQKAKKNGTFTRTTIPLTDVRSASRKA